MSHMSDGNEARIVILSPVVHDQLILHEVVALASRLSAPKLFKRQAAVRSRFPWGTPEVKVETPD